MTDHRCRVHNLSSCENKRLVQIEDLGEHLEELQLSNLTQ